MKRDASRGAGRAAAPDRHGLEVSSLTISLASGRLLTQEVSFALRPGETIGIVGESGSGKSLTARAVMGLLDRRLRTSGRVVLDGEDILGASEGVMSRVRGRRIGMVLQDPFTSLNPLRTVAGHIEESLRSAPGDRAAVSAEIHARLAEVGLDAAVAAKYPFQLSGGMRQRVALAAALAGDPEILIADEPTTALDVTTQAEILELLKRLKSERGMGLLLITHDLRVAFSVSDRVLVMYAGSIVESVPARSGGEESRHPYTHALRLAEPQISHYVPKMYSIPGRVPPAESVRDCCAFSTRCQWETVGCQQGRPALVQVAPEHLVACVHADSLAPRLRRERRAFLEMRPQDLRETGSGSPLISVTGLGKVYRSSPIIGRPVLNKALNGVSFDVAAGESVGLLGESGSGKTTIARSLIGLVRPDEGSIEFEGADITVRSRLSRGEARRVRQSIQMVHQDPYSTLNPSLSIDDALSEATRCGPAEDRMAVAELLELVGLPINYRNRRPAQLSGGERQRVAIARAIAVRPKLLICDEPVAALDVSVQAQVLEQLRQIRARLGMTLLFITHDLAVVRQMTERAIVLQRGVIQEVGRTSDLLDRPGSAYTKRLIASVPAHA